MLLLYLSYLKKVSILVLVDVGLRYNIVFLIIHYYNVSILVLVDVGLRYITSMDTNNYEYWSFNPCFSGCRSAIHT